MMKLILRLQFCLFLLPTVLQAGITPYSSRLLATGGAGVASALLDEATLLNPAPLAFFQLASFAYQENKESMIDLQDNTQKKRERVFIATDTSSGAKGSFSYITKTFQGEEKKQANLSIAKAVSSIASIGATYHYSDLQSNTALRDQNSHRHQFTLGVMQVPTNYMTLGLVVNDPLRVIPKESNFIAGIQLTYRDFLYLILDAGADYRGRLSDSSIIKTAVQFKILSDFYLRFGRGLDHQAQESVTGLGIGWLLPRLHINMAMAEKSPLKTSRFKSSKESSLSLSLRF